MAIFSRRCTGDAGGCSVTESNPTFTVLDSILAKAIEDAREQAKRETLSAIFHNIETDSALRSGLAEEIARMLREDDQLKQMLRDAIVRAVSSPARRY
jgi:hypothetical protein